MVGDYVVLMVKVGYYGIGLKFVREFECEFEIEVIELLLFDLYN